MAIANDVIIGRVILKREYKEQDTLITIICESGKKITFKGQGILRLTSKNAPACQLFTLSEFDFAITKSAYKTLKTAKIIKTPRSFFSDFRKTLAAIILSEVVDKLTYDDRVDSNIFIVLNKALDLLDQEYQAETILFIAIIRLLDDDGHGLIKNSCCNCGSKHNIDSLDFAQGGLLCQYCRPPNQPRYSKDFLKTAFILINSNLDNIPTVNTEFVKLLLKMIIEHLELNCGIVLKSAHYVKEL